MLLCLLNIVGKVSHVVLELLDLPVSAQIYIKPSVVQSLFGACRKLRHRNLLLISTINLLESVIQKNTLISVLVHLEMELINESSLCQPKFKGVVHVLDSFVSFVLVLNVSGGQQMLVLEPVPQVSLVNFVDLRERSLFGLTV